MWCRCASLIVIGQVLVAPLWARADPLPDGLYVQFSTSMEISPANWTTPAPRARWRTSSSLPRATGSGGSTGDRHHREQRVLRWGLFTGSSATVLSRPASPSRPRPPISASGSPTSSTRPLPPTWSPGRWPWPTGVRTPIGAGFFVTVDDEPGFNGRYTVFGHVVEGANVVEAISLVPALWRGWPPEYSIPTVDITIHSVTIQRVGTDAQNWDPPAV